MPVSGIKVQPSDQSLKNGVNYFSMPLVLFFKKYPIYDSCKRANSHHLMKFILTK